MDDTGNGDTKGNAHSDAPVLDATALDPPMPFRSDVPPNKATREPVMPAVAPRSYEGQLPIPTPPRISTPSVAVPYFKKRWFWTTIVGIFVAFAMWMRLYPEFWGHHWGDNASVAGLFVSVVGSTLTIYAATKSESASKRAEIAAKDARAALLRFDALIEITQAISTLNDIMELHRAKDWESLLGKYALVRQRLMFVKGPTSNVTEAHREVLAGVLQQIISIDGEIEACVHQGKKSSPDKPMKLMEILKNQIDNLVGIQSELRSERN